MPGRITAVEIIKNSNIPLFYETSSTAKSLCALGDCLEIMRDIPDGCVDMILCDLPYGATQNKWDSVINLDALWREYRRICRGAIVLTAQTPFDKVLGASNLQMLRYEWIWHKSRVTGHLNAKGRPMKNHENVLVFYKGLPTYNPQGLVKKSRPYYPKRRGQRNELRKGKQGRHPGI